MRNDEKTNSNIVRTQAYLLKGDKAKDIAIEGKTSDERRVSLARILHAQKSSYQIC